MHVWIDCYQLLGVLLARRDVPLCQSFLWTARHNLFFNYWTCARCKKGEGKGGTVLGRITAGAMNRWKSQIFALRYKIPGQGQA